MAKKTVATLIAVAGLVFMAGCQTSFTGSPHVENGRSGCEQKCRSQGMEVAGMVYMGEYSDACVCAVPGQAAKGRRILLASAATAAGAAGVIMQMRREDEQRRQASH